MCDKLIQDCCVVLKDKVISAFEGPLFISHDAFDVKWVPEDVIRSSLDKLEPYDAIKMVIRWLRRQTAITPSVNELLNDCRDLIDDLTISQLQECCAMSLCIAESLGIIDNIFERLVHGLGEAKVAMESRLGEAQNELCESQMALSETRQKLEDTEKKLTTALNHVELNDLVQQCQRCHQTVNYQGQNRSYCGGGGGYSAHTFSKAWSDVLISP